MVQARGDAYLAEEAVGSDRTGELGVERFDREKSVVSRIAREPDARHPAAPEQAVENVAVVEGRARCQA